MKKVLTVVSILIFFLTGCKALSPDVTAVTTGLEFSAKVIAYEEEYNLFITVFEDATVEIINLSNEAAYKLLGNEITISYGDIEYKTELSKTIENSVIGYIFSVLSSADDKKDDVLFKDGEYYLCDKGDGFDYTMYLGQTGLPLKLIDTAHDTEIIITDAALI